MEDGPGRISHQHGGWEFGLRVPDSRVEDDR
jgi:hypothetical protein